MVQEKPAQLSDLLDHKSLITVVHEIENIFCYHYDNSLFFYLYKCLWQIEKLFNGDFPGYKAFNTDYHDFDHTMDTLLATARILDGYNIRNMILPGQVAINLFSSSLFHDTGYIQKLGDDVGTGAQYTSNHVERSVAFLNNHHEEFTIEEENENIIARIIMCTGVNTDLDAIPFKSKEERIAGSILGTADLIGQMSSRIYLEKLLFLYHEFKEGGISEFHTEFDIIRKTIDFYKITQNRFVDDYMSVHEYARDHFNERFGIDKNLYLLTIEKQIKYLQTILTDDSTNFRHKLKRGNWRTTIRKPQYATPSSG